LDPVIGYEVEGVLRSPLRRADGGLSLRDSDISWCSLRGSGVPGATAEAKLMSAGLRHPQRVLRRGAEGSLRRVAGGGGCRRSGPVGRRSKRRRNAGRTGWL